MPLNINGTTGISGVDGSASAPALQGTDSNTGVSFGADTVNINTGGSTRATVDSSGNLGIGTTSPSFKLTVSSAENNLFLKQDSGDHGYILDVNQGDGSLAFNRRLSGSNTERMRIDSSGNIIVDSSSSFTAISQITSTHDGTRFGLGIHNTNVGGGNQIAIRFVRNSSDVGSISTTASATHFNTSSDYRLKENAVAIPDGITRLKTLKPYRFNWKSDSSTIVDGFFAHEVTAVPEAISGTKDAVATEDEPLKSIKKGDPIYQSIDQSKLVPLLTAALQEAIAKIEVLETKVAALEAA